MIVRKLEEIRCFYYNVMNEEVFHKQKTTKKKTSQYIPTTYDKKLQSVIRVIFMSNVQWKF